MPDDHDVPEEPTKDEKPARRPRRRPSVDEVFGDVLPDTTGDERDRSQRPSGAERDKQDEDFLRDVPPHHA